MVGDTLVDTIKPKLWFIRTAKGTDGRQCNRRYGKIYSIASPPQHIIQTLSVWESHFQAFCLLFMFIPT